MFRCTVASVVVLLWGLGVHAGDIKTHRWCPPSNPVEVCRLDLTMDVAYYVHIVDQGPIKVFQSPKFGDPYHTYYGCKKTWVMSNFPAILLVEASAASPAGGQWSATISQSQVNTGDAQVELCVLGTEVAIESLNGSASAVKVAEVKVMILPQ